MQINKVKILVFVFTIYLLSFGGIILLNFSLNGFLDSYLPNVFILLGFLASITLVAFIVDFLFEKIEYQSENRNKRDKLQ